MAEQRGMSAEPAVSGGSCPKVSFLIAGAQKCGTSALDAYLRGHPQIEMARGRKETHFFDNEDIDWTCPDYAALHRYYDLDSGRLRGEATPITVFWTACHERVHDYNPEMKLILIFRDPSLRAFSQWRKEYTRDMEPLEFSAAIREGRERVARDRDAPGDASRLFSYVERGLYAAQIKNLLRWFPLKSMLFLKSDALQHQPSETMRRVCEFLAVAPFESPVPPAVVNAGRPLRSPVEITADDWTVLTRAYREDLAMFRELTQLDISGWPTVARL
jgi:hypothetical protein